MMSSPKVQKPTTPPPPSLDDMDKSAEAELDKMIKKRGRLSTKTTPDGGAIVQTGQTTAATLLGVK